MQETCLYEDKNFIVRKSDYKIRSCVKICDRKLKTLLTYRFENIKCYQHPLLSWANLCYCAYDGAYLENAVQNGLKPLSQIVIMTEENDGRSKEHLITFQEKFHKVQKSNSFDVSHSKEKWNLYYVRDEFLIARKEKMRDLFNLDEIVEAYKRQFCYLKNSEIALLKEHLVFSPLQLSQKINWLQPEATFEFILTGLMLGYPIESTASILIN